MHMKALIALAGLLSPAFAQRVVPNAYIAELKTNTGAFLSKAKSSGISVTERRTLNQDPSIFNGVSFHLDSDTAEIRDKIESWDDVISLTPVRLYDTVAPVSTKKLLERDVTSVLSRTKRDGVVDTFPPHVQGGVDKLHAEGLTGKGVIIAVVDTGIDYDHPALGGGFGPGFKVAKGYDFVGDAYTGDNTPMPKPDIKDCAGHGTHVSGIIAAVDTFANFTGTAPGVILYGYKVFGCPAKSVSNDILIEAYTTAYNAGVDLITASIGGVSGWSEDAWAVVVQRIVEAGVPCTIAAGNDGAQGLFYASGAADAIGAIAVGSVNNLNSPEVLTVATYASTSVANKTFGYTPAVGKFGDQTLPIYLLAVNGQIFDACTPFPAGTPNLAGYLVIVRRGTCTFDTKVGNAVAAGGKNVMIVNNQPGTIEASVTLPNVNVGMVEPQTGAAWLALVNAGEKVTVAFSSNAGVYITAVANPANGGSMSTFTSWGPTYEMYQRPHVSAPGGNILSTYPLIFGGYAVLSGTSMATPYLAGVIALYKEAAKSNGKKIDPTSIRNALTQNGRPLVFNDGATNATYYAPPAQQGSGIIDAYDFVHSATLIDVDLLEFNDTNNFHPSLDFKITNGGSDVATYDLTSLAGATAYTTDPGSILASAFPPEMNENYATVSIEPNTLSIKPGQSKRVVVRVTLPTGLDTARIPVYGGWVQVKTSGNVVASIPYMGVAAEMKKVTVTDTESGFPMLVNAASSQPAIAWSLAMGSQVVRVDIASVSSPSSNDVTVFTDKVLGSFPGYPALYNPRNIVGQNTTSIWNGRVVKAPGAASVPVTKGGQYKFIYRALKDLGSVNTGRDYERWESPAFTYSG